MIFLFGIRPILLYRNVLGSDLFFTYLHEAYMTLHTQHSLLPSRGASRSVCQKLFKNNTSHTVTNTGNSLDNQLCPRAACSAHYKFMNKHCDLKSDDSTIIAFDSTILAFDSAVASCGYRIHNDSTISRTLAGA